MKWSFLLCSLLAAFAAEAQSLRIATGTWDAQGTPCPALRILPIEASFGANAVVDVPENAPFAASILNEDSLAHTVVLDDVSWEGVAVGAGQSVAFEWPALPAGTYRYHLVGERGERLGGSGILRSGFAALGAFRWHLADVQSDALDTLAQGALLDPADYTPDYFTINEVHFPNTLDDPHALVEVNLGDTALISVVNAGQMDHVLHFHGFHVTLLTSSRSPERAGWIKDSVPVRRGEGLTLQLVANQAGTYPVHDHNLIAVTNAGFYPGGMLTQIIVAP